MRASERYIGALGGGETEGKALVEYFLVSPDPNRGHRSGNSEVICALSPPASGD